MERNNFDIEKFSICLMNPPYSKGLHMKFLYKLVDIIDKDNGKLITIQPSNKAFTDINQAKTFKQNIESKNIRR